MKRLLLLFLLPIACLGSIAPQVDKTGPFLITSLPQTIPVGFPFQTGNDLLVLDTGPSGSPHDPALVLVGGSDYTVSGGGYNSAVQMQTGSVICVGTGSTPVAVNDNIVVMRNVPINQTSSFSSTGPLTIQQIEQALDKTATLSQQVNEIAQRSLQFENFEFNVSPTLSKSARENSILTFDSNGNILWVPTSEIGGGTQGAAGLNTWVQYNSNGKLGANSGFTSDNFGNVAMNSIGLQVTPGSTSAVLGIGTVSTVLSPTYNSIASLNGNFTATSGNSWGMTLEPSFVASGATGTSNGLSLQDTYNLTGGSTNTDTDFNLTRIETSLGSGSHYFENFNVAGSGTKWSVDHLGNATGNSFNAFANVAAMEAASTSGWSNGAVVSTLGYYAQNDGGQGTYVWNSSSTATANGGTVIQVTGVTTGRLLLAAPTDGRVPMSQFGTHGNVVLSAGLPVSGTDDTAAIQAWANYITANNYRGVIDGSKIYKIAGTVTFTGPVDILVNYASSGDIVDLTPFIFYHTPTSGVDCFVFQAAGGATGYTKVTLDGVTVRGNKSYGSGYSAYGFHFLSPTQLNMRHCMANYFNYGCLFETLIDSWLTDLDFSNCVTFGFKHISTSSTGTTTTATNFNCTNDGQYGGVIYQNNSWTFSGINYFESINAAGNNSSLNCAGLLIDYGSEVDAQTLYLEGNMSHGINVGPVSSNLSSFRVDQLNLFGGGTTTGQPRPDVVTANYCSELRVGAANNPGGSLYRASFIRITSNTAFGGFYSDIGAIGGIGGGTWTATTAYNLGDRVIVGNYTWACQVAGTSGGTIPATLSNGGYDSVTQQVSDGSTLIWKLANVLSDPGGSSTVPFYTFTTPGGTDLAPYTRSIVLARPDGTEAHSFKIGDDSSNNFTFSMDGTGFMSYLSASSTLALLGPTTTGTLQSGASTGGGGLTVTSTAENRVILQSYQDSPVGILFQAHTQTTGHYNWLVGSQQLANQTFQIIPSTAINGTTFSTAALTINPVTNVVTLAGNLTVGGLTGNGPVYTSGGNGALNTGTTTGSGTVYALATSPALAGTPTAPTATAGTNTTQLATTAFVQSNSGLFSVVADFDYSTTTASGATGGSGSAWSWALPSGAHFINIVAVGPGGGGASGRKSSVLTAGGGGGGQSGEVSSITLPVSLLPSTTLTITIPQGGGGGASVTADTTNGNPGTGAAGTTVVSSSGTVLIAATTAVNAQATGGLIGAGGAGGTVVSISSGQPGQVAGVAGGAGGFSGAGGAGSGSLAILSLTAGSGGGGGGVNTTGTAGGAGGFPAANINSTSNSGGGGAGGAATGAGGGAGSTVAASGLFFGAGGGGGGANAAGTGGTGGAGYRGGGGGGGGGSSGNSGAGGAGGDGFVRITVY